MTRAISSKVGFNIDLQSTDDPFYVDDEKNTISTTTTTPSTKPRLYETYDYFKSMTKSITLFQRIINAVRGLFKTSAPTPKQPTSKSNQPDKEKLISPNLPKNKRPDHISVSDVFAENKTPQPQNREAVQ
jgi:hypothetical protein